MTVDPGTTASVGVRLWAAGTGMRRFSKEQPAGAALADRLASRAPIGSWHVGVARSRGRGQWGRWAGRAASAAGARARRGAGSGGSGRDVTGGGRRRPPAAGLQANAPGCGRSRSAPRLRRLLRLRLLLLFLLFLLLLLALLRALRRCLLHNFPRKFRNSAPGRPSHAPQPPWGAAGERRGCAAAWASRSLHLPQPLPPLPPGARLWADPGGGGRGRSGGVGVTFRRPRLRLGFPALPRPPHVRSRSWSAGSVLPQQFL